jgi:hypothetical protein
MTGHGLFAAVTPAVRLLRWLGRFHVLVIHFPIALLTAAALAEAWALWRDVRGPWPAARFLVLFGAGGAAVAGILGWLHAGLGGAGGDAPELLGPHRWLGTAAAVLAVATALASERDARRGRRGWSFRALLGGGVMLTGAAAHLGGLLVHGAEFFTW